MIKKLNGLVVLVLVLALVMVGCSAPTDGQTGGTQSSFIRIGTASMGGNFFPLGSAISQLINEEVEGINSSAQATGGSSENCNFLQSGEIELALVQSATLADAYNGKGGFDGRAIEELRGITSIYFNEFHILVRKDAGIETVADLKGKKIAVGPVGGGIEVNTNQLLAEYGISPDDYTPVYGTRGEATEGLKTGRVDCHIYGTGVGSAQVTELMLTGDIKLIQIEGDIVEKILANNPHFGYGFIPANTYKGQTEDIKTVVGSSVLCTTSKMSEEQVYTITKTIFENKEYLETFHKYFKQTQAEKATIGMAPPLHPGAEKYFKEIGVIK